MCTGQTSRLLTVFAAVLTLCILVFGTVEVDYFFSTELMWVNKKKKYAWFYI
jgi:hypothetical protein